MPAIRFSTLRKLAELTSINLTTEFPDIPFHLLNMDLSDKLIEISQQEEAKIAALLQQILQPDEIPEYHNEYAELLQQIQTTKVSIESLEKASFRQSRNAFGSASGLFGGVNLLLTNMVTWSLALNSILLFGPAILMAGWIYQRGKREEQQINMDLEAELFDRKISLHAKYKELIQLRMENNALQGEEKNRPRFLPTQQIFNGKKPPKFFLSVKPYKEKRNIIGNPLSHFIFPTLSAIGMTYSLIKMGLFGAAIIAGGPLAWGIAIGFGCCVGLYFSYKRYQHLTKKIMVEKNMTKLVAKDKSLDLEIATLRNQQTATYKNLLTSFKRENGFLSKPAVVNDPIAISTTDTPLDLASQSLPEFVQYAHPYVPRLVRGIH